MHVDEVHGPKMCCPDLSCGFIFPTSRWDLFEGHRLKHGIFDIGEPIPLLKKRKTDTYHPRGTSVPKGTVEPIMPIIPLENLRQVDCVTTWPLAGSSNPLGLTMDQVIEQEESGSPSDWEEEPEGGFLELLDISEPDIIVGVMKEPPAWRLIPIDVMEPTPRLLRRLPDQQRCHDPRLA